MSTEDKRRRLRRLVPPWSFLTRQRFLLEKQKKMLMRSLSEHYWRMRTMTKHEFMARLASELRKRNVADAADVTQEYEQHFAFKLADGYSEEEIAAKLGSPEELAAQFESTDTAKKVGGSKALAVTGLCFADLSAGSLQFWHAWGWFQN